MKNLTVIFLLIFSTNVFAQNTAEEWFQKGKETENLQEKITYFNKAISLNYRPMADAYYRRGLAKHLLRDYKSAIGDMTQAIELLPTNVQNYLLRGGCYTNIGKYEKAMQDYNHIISVEPDYAPVYYHIAVLKKLTKEYEAVIENCNKAIELDYVQKWICYSLKANVYTETKKYDDAIQAINQALKMKPNQALFYYEKAKIKGRQHKYQEAIECYTQTIQIDENFDGVYNSRAMLYHKLKQYQEAIQDYNKSIKLRPKAPYPYNNRALTKCMLGDYRDALKDCNYSLKLDSQNSYAYKNRGLIYKHLKKYKKAIKDYNKAIELKYPDVWECYNARGSVYFEMGKYKEAIADWEMMEKYDVKTYKPDFNYIKKARKAVKN